MIPRPRFAVATDGPICAPLITEAGGELLRWALGDDARALALIARCWQTPGHPLGPTHCRVLEVEQQVVGAVVGGPTDRWLKAERATPIRMAGLARGGTLRAISQRLSAQHAARPSLRHDGWYLSSLGIVPSHRRRGLGRVLLADSMTRARAAGCAGVSVEVVAANTAACTLYAAEGFAEVQRWTPRGGPEVVRMWRPLR